MQNSIILVVDDELFFRRLYADLLMEEGYQVETVASGEEAMVRLHQGGVDLLVADLVMPGIDGLEVLRQARLLENPPEVILTTSHATVETAIQALKSGARDYLIKPFKPEELRHLVRTSLEQRRLLDENLLLKSQIRLFQRGQSLSSILEIDRLLPQAVETLLHEVGPSRGFAFMLGHGREPRFIGREGVTEAECLALLKVLLPFFRGLSTVRQVRGTELKAVAPALDFRCACLFSLRSQKKIQGGLILLNRAGGELPYPIPMDSLVFLSEQTALGFENAYLYQGARELIHTDDLTGLFNYRYLQQVLGQEIRRTERYGLCFTLVFIDLDHFKGINDTFGHLVGSATLKEVAQLLRQSVREVDMLFRYGGDEFTALLVETDCAGGGRVAERIRVAIEGHEFRAGEDKVARITATVGYATFPEHAGNQQDIVDLADRAMYFGKKTRNVTRGAWELKDE